MKEYIDYNTEMRKRSKNTFESDFYKLLNNSVFGKTMENVRKRVNVKIETTQEKLEKRISKDTYIRHKTIREDSMYIIQERKKEIKLNKPIYCGFAILEASKRLMFDFHYNYMLKRFNYKDCKLCFTDTDSLLYHINTGKGVDIHDVLLTGNDADRFDTSNYPKDSKYYTDTRKKVVGKFKDECGGAEMAAFVGLKAKMYSFKVNNKETKKAKGVKKEVAKNNLTFDTYLNVLMEGRIHKVTQHSFRSDKHQVYTTTTEKIGLSAYDDKRYILDDGCTTLAYGHYKTRED